MGELCVGDKVFDESGRPCTVTGVFENLPDVAYRLHFSDGTSLEACGDHQWVTWTHAERKAFLRSPYEDTTRFPEEWPAWRLRRKLGRQLSREVIEQAIALSRSGMSMRAIEKALDVCRASIAKHIHAGRYLEREAVVHDDAPGPQIRTTQQIADTLTYGKRDDTNHCVPVCGALQLPDLDLPIDPYLLGVWLGNGFTDSGGIASHLEDKEHYRIAIARAGFIPTVRSHPLAIGTIGFHTKLRETGLLGHKHVPEIYLRASAAQRLALVRGLMDTDGTCDNDGAHVEFGNTNRNIIDSFMELARSLGQKPVELPIKIVEGYKDFWRITWTPTIDVFSSPRKSGRWRSYPKDTQQLRNHHRMIVGAERIERAPMRCITVDSPHSMYLAGDGMIPTHNTRTGAETVRMMVENHQASRIALIGPTAADVRDVIVEGDSGIMSISPPWCMPKYEPSKRRLTWPTGAVATLFSADEPSRLRGPQYDFAWFDEIAICDPEALLQVRFGLRLGNNPRLICTTTPRPTPLIKDLMKESSTFVTRGSTYDNRGHLAPQFFSKIISKYEGTRIGRQELNAEILDDAPGALWRFDQLDSLRIDSAPPLKSVVVGVDPAVTSHAESDETGVVVVGLGENGHGYILADGSGRYTPIEWARKVVALFDGWKANRVIAESNQGGALVESNLRTERRSLPIRLVHASRGKHIRAEPIASLFEQGRIHLVGSFPKLESQMCEWEPGVSTWSADRVDALVWACTDLLIDHNPDTQASQLPTVKKYESPFSF